MARIFKHPLSFFIASLLAMTRPASSQTQAAPSGNQPEKWAGATSGMNLADGRPVWFSRKPNYLRYSKTGHDKKLTDGILSPVATGKIWFSDETVGWSSGPEQGVDLLIDLGRPERIDRVVSRFVGGRQRPNQGYPAELTILLGDDGKTFYQAARRQKVHDGEAELAQSNPGEYFYFPETGTVFVEPVTLPVGATARYVVLRLRGESNFVWMDELAILKDETQRPLPDASSFPKAFFVHEGVSIQPRTEILTISTNIPTPNFFGFLDFREGETGEAVEPFEMELDLPSEIELLTLPEGGRQLAEAGEGRVRYHLPSVGLRHRLTGPYYFRVKAGAKLPEKAEARLSWVDGETLKNGVTIPLQAMEIPVVPKEAAALNASLTWMVGREINQWPEFYSAYRDLGFSHVPVFPWMDEEEAHEITRKAREHGFGVVLNDSVFHRMAASYKDRPEIFNVVRGKAGKFVNPLYTGSLYQKTIERIGRLARAYAPDYIFYDIELWQKGYEETRKSEAARTAFKQSGEKEWEAFIIGHGTRMMTDLHNATQGTAPRGRNPVVSLYNTKAEPPVYHKIYDFRQLYPEAVQVAAPSLYVGGEPTIVGETIRSNYAVLGKRDIIPWITARTYAPYPPFRLEQIILEAYLNGAGGITYYAFRDFDPATFYYHARALATLAPYAPLLTNGTLIEADSPQEAFRCSAFGREDEALLLVGNYRNLHAAAGKVRLAGKVVHTSEITPTGAAVPADLDRVEIPAGGHRLFLVTFEP
ncbi:MAG TPA: discoidin domain-containing protein [Chthoniobacteraceae bacterium]|nr:discoidin domain-containing protein [Chthoniobacteraceae bacterium]